MSLINQMLQDLDARRATQAPGVSLPSAVRPLPPAQPEARWPLRLALLAVLCALGGGAAWYFLGAPKALAPAPAPELAPPPPAAPPPALAPAELASPAPAPVVAESETPAATSEAATESTSLGESLRLSEQLARQQVKTVSRSAKGGGSGEAPSPGAAVTPRGTESKPVRAPIADSVTPGATAGASRPAPAARAGNIERNEAQATPRERAEAAYRKGIGAVNQGRLGEGNDALREALQLDPLHVPARQLFVRLLLEARQGDAAMQVLEAGLQVLPAQIGWAMSLARLQLERGDVAAAWQTLQHSEPAAQGNADYQGFAGHVLQRLGKPREAAEHYRHALRSSPADGRWWLGLGLALEAEGRLDEARDAWNTARRSSNLSPDLQRLLDQKLK